MFRVYIASICHPSTNWTVISPTGFPCGNVSPSSIYTDSVADSYSGINAFLFLNETFLLFFLSLQL